MKKIVALLCLFSSMALAADLDTKADSMVYDKPTEWRIYSPKGAALAFVVQNDLLWIATGETVSTIKMKSGEQKNYSTLGDIPSSAVTSIALSTSNEVWFGGPGGLVMKNDKGFTSFSTAQGLPSASVTALLATGDGAIWIGTDSGLVCRTSGGGWKTYTQKDGLPSDKIQALAEGANNNVIVGTSKGIAIENGGSWTIHTMKNGLSWNDTKALAYDPRTQKIWAAVGDKDINCLENGTWNNFMEIQEEITSIMIDTQSRVWIGSKSGLLKFNGDEWISDSKVHGVPATQVAGMYRDAGGNLWFAMESGVLRMANPYPF